MPSIITAATLRAVLGVSSALYNDAYLNGIIDTAEGVILPQLDVNAEAIDYYWLSNNVAYFHTRRDHGFIAGQSVVVAGLPAPFTATHTVVTPTSNIGGVYVFSAALTNADVIMRDVHPNGTATLSGQAASTVYATNANVIAAVTELSVQVFRTRVSPDSNSQGVDFTSFAMGRALFSKVKGLLGNEIDIETLAQ